jgi:hypothetical protein
LDQLLIASRVLGRKAAEILKQSTALEQRILTILETSAMDPTRSSIARQWAKQKDWDMAYAGSLLNELKMGILETIARK